MTRPPELKLDVLLDRLIKGGVDFVVIGGIAAVVHGSPRNTFDLDICFATDDANLDALGAVLVGLRARLKGVTEELPFVADARTLATGRALTLRTPDGDIDLLAKPRGAPSYDTLRRNAERYDVAGSIVRVASLADLMAMKQEADRPRDRADLVELETISRLRRRM